MTKKHSSLNAAPKCGVGHSLSSKSRKRQTGLRLSWPYGVEHRRAIVSKVQSASTNVHVRDIVHTSSEDIQRHGHLLAGLMGNACGTEWQVLDLQIPMVPIVTVEAENQDRFQYFQHTASKALAIPGHDPVALGNVLIKIALASNTSSAQAVRECLLAYSALHRYGIHAQAAESKIAGLNALKLASVSSVDTMDTLEAIQHVAAGMLLLQFEIHQSMCTSEDWTRYLRGVKNVIRVADLDRPDNSLDLRILLDWVHYHDVLARFTLRHWYRKHGKSAVKTITTSCTSLEASSRTTDWIDQAMHRTAPSLELVDLLSELCDLIPSPLCGLTPTEREARKPFLEMLSWKIRNMKPPAASRSDSQSALVLELYKLAMLVYLNRVTSGQLKHASSTPTQIARAFEILPQLDICERQLPVFIIGCEAQSDAQRAAVLDVMSRTASSVASRSMNHVRVLLQAIWAQDDLCEGKAMYWSKLSYVISCCAILPSFT